MCLWRRRFLTYSHSPLDRLNPITIMYFTYFDDYPLLWPKYNANSWVRTEKNVLNLSKLNVIKYINLVLPGNDKRNDQLTKELIVAYYYDYSWGNVERKVELSPNILCKYRWSKGQISNIFWTPYRIKVKFPGYLEDNVQPTKSQHVHATNLLIMLVLLLLLLLLLINTVTAPADVTTTMIK